MEQEAEPIPLTKRKKTNETNELVADVFKMEQERVDAARSPEERLADVVALWGHSDQEPLNQVDISNGILQLDRLTRDLELLAESTPEQRATLDMEEKMVTDVEAEAAKREMAPLELSKAARNIHDLAANIIDAVDETDDYVNEAGKAPEEFYLRMRMAIARDAQISYEALAGKVANMLNRGGDLHEVQRADLIKLGENLLGHIKYEQQQARLAEKNFMDDMAAKIAVLKRRMAEKKAA